MLTFQVSFRSVAQVAESVHSDYVIEYMIQHKRPTTVQQCQAGPEADRQRVCKSPEISSWNKDMIRLSLPSPHPSPSYLRCWLITLQNTLIHQQLRWEGGAGEGRLTARLVSSSCSPRSDLTFNVNSACSWNNYWLTLNAHAIRYTTTLNYIWEAGICLKTFIN